MIFLWNPEKNEMLKQQRGVSFEDVEKKILEEKSFEVRRHHNQEMYPHQKVYIVQIKEYVYFVPFVENQAIGEIFLKTIVPSRKLKKEFLS